MKASNVTGETYAEKARTFVELNRGKAHVVAPWRVSIKTDTFPATPGSWAAWLAYWRRIGYPVRAIEQRGHATVPTLWPHEFDDQANVADDTAAADAYRAERAASAERNRTFNVDGAARSAAGDHALQRIRDYPMREPTPKQDLLLDLIEGPR